MKKKNIYSIALLVVIIEIIIKFIGFAKQSIMAYYYGANNEMDVYFVASDFINGLSNAIITSSKIAIVSVYTSIKIKKGKEESDNLISFLLELIVPISIVCSSLIYVFSELLAKILGPKLNDQSLDTLSLYIKILSGIFVLSIICMVLDAVLNSHEKYFVSRLRSFIYSSGIIIGSILFAKKFGINVLLTMQYLTLIVYVIIQFISSRKLLSFHFTKKSDFQSIKYILIMVIPTFIGNSMVQFNYWVDNAVATTLDEGSVSALSYSHVLDDFFIGIMIASVTSVLFPHFANLVEKGNEEEVRGTLIKGMSTMFIFLIPISIASFFAAKDMVTVAYFRGEFKYETLLLTTLALQGYTIRYPFVAIRDISIQGLYAYKNTKGPMIVALISAAINVFFSIILSKFFGIIAITIGTTISAVLGSFLNFRLLRKHIDGIHYRDIFSSLYKGIPVGIITIIIVVLEKNYIHIQNSILDFIVICATVAVVFFGGMLLLNDKTVTSITKNLLSKLHLIKQ